MAPEISTLAFDGPHRTPNGGYMNRVFAYDEHGCEIGWFSIDSGDPDYAPTAEHPDRDFLRWPEGVDQPFSFYNNEAEGWACPSEDAAIFAAFFEHASRNDEDWYFENGACRVAV
jgi:hypothetical protein